MKPLLILSLSLVSATAFADRVSGSPPTDCPPGSYPSVDHGGPHCAIVRCTSDAECNWDPALSCGPRASICVVVDEYNTYARRPHQRERAASACVAGACTEGECETARFCVRGSPTTMDIESEPTVEPTMEPEPTMEAEPTMETNADAASTEESGCSAGGGVTAGSAASGCGAFLLLFLWRRR